MAVPSYGNELISFCEAKGLAQVRRLRHVENHFHSLDWERVDKWVAMKEAELRDESVAISRQALANSKRATKLAVFALILSLVMAGQKLVEWYSR